MLNQFDRCQFTVGRHSQLDTLPRTWPIAGCEMLCRAGQHKLDRCAGLARELRCHNNLGTSAEFRAEPAAKITRNNSHILRRKGKKNHQIITYGKDPLSRNPYGKLIVIPFGDSPVSFERYVG